MKKLLICLSLLAIVACKEEVTKDTITLSETTNKSNVLIESVDSPAFENYVNYNGGTTSLSDLKGKYTYIDVWATWCGPCKAEIPSLKSLEHDYAGKKINFVSLSIDDDRTHGGSWEKAAKDWKAMVANKKLGGIQIMAPKGWESKFVKDYKIRGIPRFILIDPNGKIVNANAPRPSSKTIRVLFDSLEI